MRIHPIDRLGMIKAQIAALEEEEDRYRDQVQRLGPGTHSGRLYDATVSSSTKVTVDMDAVRVKLGEAWVARHSRRTPTVVVRVTARKTGSAATTLRRARAAA